MIRTSQTAARRGFTLIELLVVIAIIGVLVALTVVAVMKVAGKGAEVADIDDIKLLEMALGKFKEKHGCYPPDLIKLCHYSDHYGGTLLDQESRRILQQIWPQLFKLAVSPTDSQGRTYAIPWVGVNPATGIANPLPTLAGQQCVILQGDQCLVFFLGGHNGTDGFNDSTTAPIHDRHHTAKFPGQRPGRIVYFEFQRERLKAFPGSAAPRFDPNGSFPSYLDNQKTTVDPQAKPYVYFAGGNRGGYNATGAPNHQIAVLGGVGPYCSFVGGKPRYPNPSTFQIIGAGRDGNFGTLPAAGWDLANAPPGGGEPWFDNRSNFWDRQLGVQQ